MNLKIGTFLGVPLYVNWSALLALAGSYLLAGWLGLIFTILGFIFVILHEYGHVFVAQHFGWEVLDVTIYLIGGIANMKIRVSAKEEIWVGAAGPLVSLLLLLLFAGIAFILPPPLIFVAILCAIVNALIVFYNLLPILPMDGGRILRALITMCTKDYLLSTWWTVRIGEVVGVGFTLLAFYFGAWSWGAITAFMVFVSWIEEQNARAIGVVLRTRSTVAAVLNRPELTNATVPQLLIVLEEMDESKLEQLNLKESLLILKQSEHLSI
jgi:Zn-dependent protease